MSRSVSLEFLQSVFSQETDEIYVQLITISHASLNPPIRVCDLDVNFTSRGQEYISYPFELSLPSDVDESAPVAKITIDNVDRQIVKAIREATGEPPQVTMEIVMYSDPDTVIASFPEFNLRTGSYNALNVEAELVIDIRAAEPFPAGRFTPASFPGMF